MTAAPQQRKVRSRKTAKTGAHLDHLRNKVGVGLDHSMGRLVLTLQVKPTPGSSHILSHVTGHKATGSLLGYYQAKLFCLGGS